MKVALVHDYLKEYGGAERVLEALHEIYPEAPVYVAVVDKTLMGKFWDKFANWDIRTSWFNKIPGAARLCSPLRFLAPLIWESFDFRGFDMVISSASWYITKGIITQPETLHICYCHTPPRFLYGYASSRPWQRYWPVRIYAHIVNHFLRTYDYLSAQRVNYFIANSHEVASRIKKFYKRDSTIIYPPLDLKINKKKVKIGDYFLTGGRLVDYKNFNLIIGACNKLEVSLKIFGDGPMMEELKKMAGKKIDFLGKVSDEELLDLYGRCKAFIAAATDEEFGITLLEVMASGRPVIAFRGGGYLDIVVEGKTGVFFDEPTVESLVSVLRKFKPEKYKPEDCRNQAQKFSKERFKKEIKEFVEKKYA